MRTIEYLEQQGIFSADDESRTVYTIFAENDDQEWNACQSCSGLYDGTFADLYEKVRLDISRTMGNGIVTYGSIYIVTSSFETEEQYTAYTAWIQPTATIPLNDINATVADIRNNDTYFNAVVENNDAVANALHTEARIMGYTTAAAEMQQTQETVVVLADAQAALTNDLEDLRAQFDTFYNEVMIANEEMQGHINHLAAMVDELWATHIRNRGA